MSEDASKTGQATVPAAPVGGPSKMVLSPTDTPPATPAATGKFDADAAAKKAFDFIQKKRAPDLKPAAPVPPVEPPAPPAAAPAPVAAGVVPADVMDALLGIKSTPDPVLPVEETIPLESVPEQYRPNMANLRKSLDSARKESAEFKKQVEELTKKVGLPPEETKKLQEENKSLSETLGRISLEQHPAFRAKYDGQKEAILANMKPLLVAYGVTQEEVDKVAANVLRSSPDKRLAILKDHVPEEQVALVFGALAPLGAQADQIEKARSAELTNHAATLQTLRVQEDEQAKARDHVYLAGVKQQAIQEVSEHEPLLRDIPGNEKWNEFAGKLRANVDALFGTQDPLTHAKAFVLAATAPVQRSMAEFWKAKYIEAEKALKDRNIAVPGVGAAPVIAQSGSGIPKMMNSRDAIAELARRQRAGTL